MGGLNKIADKYYWRDRIKLIWYNNIIIWKDMNFLTVLLPSPVQTNSYPSTQSNKNNKNVFLSSRFVLWNVMTHSWTWQVCAGERGYSEHLQLHIPLSESIIQYVQVRDNRWPEDKHYMVRNKERVCQKTSGGTDSHLLWWHYRINEGNNSQRD